MTIKLKLYNTLNSNNQIFIPLDHNIIKIYVCGPTVYDYAHIGNARSVVVYDILYRILTYIYGKEHVVYIRNITDIDDKIIIKAKELSINIYELTKKTTAYFHEHVAYLNCLAPTNEPKATEHLNEMIEIIERLIKQDYAYIADSHVYFHVAKYQDYTKLSGRKINEMQAGARIAVDINKKDSHDFVLWKAAENPNDYSINFPSPWGLGRPGWHIECSAMSYKYLGEDFDIHGGGADLIFPHHTNEIAQSRCAFPGSIHANFWVHNGFLTVNNEKMSKSLGNFVTIQDLIDQKFPGEVIRLFLMSRNYRQPLDYNNKSIDDAYKTLNYWYRAIENINLNNSALSVSAFAIDNIDENLRRINDNEEFISALFDDMNIPYAIKIINDYAKKIHNNSNIIDKELYAHKLLACANFIGLLHHTPQKWFSTELVDDEIENLLHLRKIAKNDKNWQKADQIRAQLLAKNIIIEDHPDGTTTAKKLNHNK